MLKKMPMKNHENILVFYKKMPTYNPQMTENKAYFHGFNHKNNSTNYNDQIAVTTENTGQRYPLSIQFFKRDSQFGKSYAPTQKPIALFEYLIKTYTNEGDLVLDNCIGSGTTAIAALNTGRFFIGIEKEQQYVDIANE